MERRDRSLKALNELIYIDSLDDNERAQGIKNWALKYLNNEDITDFDLEKDDLVKLSELFYKNTTFLINHRENILEELKDINKMKKFLNH